MKDLGKKLNAKVSEKEEKELRKSIFIYYV